MKRKWILLAVCLVLTVLLVVGCAVEQSTFPESTLYIPDPTVANSIGDHSSLETAATNAVDTAEPNIKQDLDVTYDKYIDTLLSKHVEWSALNDDVAGALYFMRMGEKGPFDCYTPIVHSNDVEYYTTHNYDDRTVIGGAIQILGSEFKQGESCAQLLIFGYRLGVNSYLDSGFATKYNIIFLLMDGEITQFRVFGVQELALEQTMDYTNGTIPAEANDLINTIESYTNEEKLLYYGQIANIAQRMDTTSSKVLILCSDGKALDPHTMSVLYACEIPSGSSAQ